MLTMFGGHIIIRLFSHVIKASDYVSHPPHVLFRSAYDHIMRRKNKLECLVETGETYEKRALGIHRRKSLVLR